MNYDVEKGVADYARESNWRLVSFAQHGGDLDVAMENISAYDGLLTLARHEDLASHMRCCNIPVVDLDDTVLDVSVHRVLLDDIAIGRLAAQHLIEQGLSSLSFLELTDSGQSRGRKSGFADAAIEHGAILQQINLFDTKPTEVLRVLADRLTSLDHPLGVMVNHDNTAWLVVEACKIGSLRIPEDIALIGVGNHESISDQIGIELTSVEEHSYRQGYSAASLLDRLMDGEILSTSPIRIEPSHVVVRQTTNALMASDESLQLAMEFIRQNFKDPGVTVNDVVRAGGMSRRKLYTVFKQHFSMGIGEVLIKARINEAKRLLTESELKVHAVARESGFSSGEQLTRAFGRTLGKTPSTFRSDRPAKLDQEPG